jgi:hypothetical protein
MTVYSEKADTTADTRSADMAAPAGSRERGIHTDSTDTVNRSNTGRSTARNKDYRTLPNRRPDIRAIIRGQDRSVGGTCSTDGRTWSAPSSRSNTVARQQRGPFVRPPTRAPRLRHATPNVRRTAPRAIQSAVRPARLIDVRPDARIAYVRLSFGAERTPA